MRRQMKRTTASPGHNILAPSCDVTQYVAETAMCVDAQNETGEGYRAKRPHRICVRDTLSCSPSLFSRASTLI